jgi:hypothetical protein
MKDHTHEEKTAAKSKLPRPIYDFLGSKALMNIYQGISKKLGLNFRQIFAVSEVTNITLIGLEPETAFEANIHQLLPELSNDKTRELVADINDRVFKEAKRRMQEGILDDEVEAEEGEPLPPAVTDRELEAMGERERADGFVPEFEKQLKAEEAREAAAARAAEEERKAAAEKPAPVTAPQKPAPLVTTPSLSIAVEKLNSVTVSAPQPRTVTVPPETQADSAPVSATSAPAAKTASLSAATPPPKPAAPQQTPSPAAPAQTATPAPKPMTPVQYESGTDPYRERPE